jgi:hypothetical protein
MPVDERARHRLFGRLEEILGSEEATILMEHLPPVGWADVATKRDLDALAEVNQAEHQSLAETFRRDHQLLAETFRREHQALAEHVRLEHELLRQSMETMEQRILATTRAEARTLLFALVSSVISVGGLAFAAARLT